MDDVLSLLHHLALGDPQGRLGHRDGEIVDLDAVELADGDLNGVDKVTQDDLVAEAAQHLVFQLAQGDVGLGQEVARTAGRVQKFQPRQLMLKVSQAAFPGGLHRHGLNVRQFPP